MVRKELHRHLSHHSLHEAGVNPCFPLSHVAQGVNNVPSFTLKAVCALV